MSKLRLSTFSILVNGIIEVLVKAVQLLKESKGYKLGRKKSKYFYVQIMGLYI